MIYEITSSLPRFKSMSFKRGLNVILATKSENAHDRQSRNGAGKTSLVETIHFLLGAKAEPKSVFRTDPLKEHSFSMKLDINGKNVIVTRRGANPNKVSIKVEALGRPVAKEHPRTNTEETQISNEEWKDYLGKEYFNLDKGNNVSRKVNFRQLFPYFARREKNGGFVEPLQHTSKLSIYYKQLAGSILLGLDERIVGDFEELRKQGKLISALKKAAKGEALKSYVPSSASLRSELMMTRAKVTQLKERVATFRVVQEYEHLELEANLITQEISSLNEENVLDLERIKQLEASLLLEAPPEIKHLKQTYEAAGVLLGNTVTERFEQVQAFHQAVIRNRKSHLRAELDDARNRIRIRKENRAKAEERRTKIMEILSSGGALEHFNKLNEEVARYEAELQTLKQRLADASKLESAKSELDTERNKLYIALQNDYRERDGIIEQAVLSFAGLSKALYEKAGKLTVTPTLNGPEFSFDISGQKSKGIQNMQIFCFDLMVIDLVTKRGTGPRFLIHDSHLFDGVDERQVARAIQLGANHSKENEYQYIVTLNSDAVPNEGFDRAFNFEDYLNEVNLTDAEETGGLFGLRFD